MSSAVMDVFIVAEDIPADEHTRKLLSALLANTELLKSTSSDSLVECLVDLLPFEAELVYQFSHLLVKMRGEELLSLRTAFIANAPHLVNIALTIQRMGGEFRSKGLDLFEDLLVLGVQDALAAINELDLRPVNIHSVIRRVETSHPSAGWNQRDVMLNNRLLCYVSQAAAVRMELFSESALGFFLATDPVGALAGFESVSPALGSPVAAWFRSR